MTGPIIFEGNAISFGGTINETSSLTVREVSASTADNGIEALALDRCAAGEGAGAAACCAPCRCHFTIAGLLAGERGGRALLGYGWRAATNHPRRP